MDYSQDGQACRQTFIYRITEGLPVILPEPGIIPRSFKIFFLTLTLRYP